jgi:UDP:flavonoid glycosyltransferase YjiC (YdhE family)
MGRLFFVTITIAIEMAHIYFLCSGTRGDVQPYLALGVRLRQAGHTVTITTHPPFRALVEARGLRFGLMDGNPSETMMRTGSKPVFSPGTGLHESLAWLREMRAVYARMLASAWQACCEAEALVVNLPTLWGISIAEALRAPLIVAPLQPLTRTRAYPSAIAPTTLSLGSGYNALSHRIIELALWLPWRGVINEWRTRTLGLRPLPLSGSFSALYARGVPFVYGFSPRVVPRPVDWPATHTIAGYWSLPSAPLADDVQRFLDAGPPPVYVSFGSMGGERTVAAIARGLNVDGIRTITPARSEVVPSPLHLTIDDVPHAELFPRLAAVIHHGGAGTTGTALRAGVPQLIVPFAVDQFFWGKRVFELGVGPRPIPHASLKPAHAVEAIKLMTDDPGMRQQAGELARQLATEDGVGQAIRLIQSQL